MLRFWEDFQHQCDVEKVDTVIHVGDVIEGKQAKQFGAMLFTPEIDEQIEIAAQLLRPLVKNRKFRIIDGSKYHESDDTSVAKAVAQELKGDCISSAKITDAAFYRVEGVGKTIFLQHGAGGNWMYQGGKMSKAMVWHGFASSRGKLPEADIYVNAHFHNYQKVEDSKKMAIQLPAWKIYEPSIIYKKDVPRMQADIGGVIMKIYENGIISAVPYIYEPKTAYIKRITVL
jgi:predicted phosphodiesterase